MIILPNEIYDIFINETKRQKNNVELIASENFVSNDILTAMGSIFTNKYAEGYPAEKNDNIGLSGRYYGGCDNMDDIERLCRQKWKEVFNTDYHVNVQPHSGSNANIAAYMSILNQGDTVLSMALDEGGHLSHGAKVNISGKTYNFIHYNLDDNGYIDMNDVREKAERYKPKLILAGGSAYSREIPFDEFYEIAKSINAYFMVDMAHIAGLIATGIHNSPFGLADIITTTTHKTLRGPRGGLIFCKPELASKVDKAVFPCLQGGPLMNVIVAKAVCAFEDLTPEYKEYMNQVVKNTKAMANEFNNLGYGIVTGGTDNHLFLLDFSDKPYSGNDAQQILDAHGITLNKNMIPNDKRTPKETSGVRIGTPAMTTKGWKEKDFIDCAHKIDSILKEL